jgi:hypothetical protein
MDLLDDLIRKADGFTQFDEKYYYLFSKSSFTDTLKKRARQDKMVKLIGVRDML